MYSRQVLICIAVLAALSACGSSTQEPVTQHARSSGVAATTAEATPRMDPSTIRVRIKLVGGPANGEVLWIPLSRIREPITPEGTGARYIMTTDVVGSGPDAAQAFRLDASATPDD
ncbi:hypothetical protein [Streptomyces sp. NPDC002599]|uniref:hypothetical protein n=1 Tax=Streptomyces sp. NPDC002599 TaxID=3154421 RepID=UPI00331BDB2A